jgi:hypothetical protein
MIGLVGLIVSAIAGVRSSAWILLAALIVALSYGAPVICDV